MGKKVFYDEDARKRLLAGAEILYNAVKTTLGPKGRNVVIGKQYTPGIVTHDGVTVAKNIELAETEETLGYKTGADFVRQAAIKMNDLAGDGTTTVTVLTYHILNEANKLIVAGHNPMLLRKGLEEAKETVLKALKELSEDITKDSKKVAEIATISAGGDKEIGKLIADVIKAVGKDGVVTVEEGQGTELESEVVKGYTFDKGFISPYMVTDTARMEAVMEKPVILITDQKIRSNNEFIPLVERMAQAGLKDLVVIAEDVEGEALTTFVLNKVKGVFRTVCIKAPSFGDSRKETLNDLAILTGATLITEDHGLALPIDNLEVLGRARRVIAGAHETTIIEGAGSPEDIENRIALIEQQAKNADTNFDKDRYRKRAAALGGKVAVIRVGGITETEIEEKQYRVDDAVHAAKAALAEGIVPGGETTHIALAGKIDLTNDGGKLLSEALYKPFEILLENAGLNAMAYYDKLKLGMGVDVTSGKLVDLKKTGVVDPTLVVKEAIQNAVSIAGTAMTMGALVVEEPVELPPVPQAPGMM